ncbi:MAG TPA: site-2 protease family protein [Lentibacillus sp.]|uniref:site-2 protease family protein n=1 Tax=Lentibacillus sp. TaxID=1925746 RepID=UPI002B4B54D6|nr:site-2 protease family protein [Lentibacillus sp.]HLR63204.1 site-2 protease family protein [Lentibacillus sp.]
MNIYIFLYLIFVVAPAGTAIHELGHLIGAKSVGADKVSLTIGAGNIVYRTIWKQMHIVIRLFFFVGGMALSERKVPYQPGERIKIAIFGPLSSLLAACICALLYIVYPGSYLLLMLLFNLWIAFINIIPFRFKDKQSDGYTIYEAIRQK